MRPWSWHWLAVVLVLAAPAAAQDYRSLSNLDFEQGAVDSFPPGWTARSALGRGFEVTLSDRAPHGGRLSAMIRRDNSYWKPESGVLAKRIDARRYRGRRVKVAAWLRYEGPPGYGALAGLTIRVRGVQGREEFYGDTDDRPVRSDAWTYREVLAEVAADADTIAFGAYLIGGGRAYVDDVSLATLGPIGEGDQPARALTARGTENLVAFARLLGYLRYFHPSDESAATDWNALAIAGVDEVEGAPSAAALASSLERLFHPIAPTLRVATRPLPPLTPAMLRPKGSHPSRVTGWWHHGWGSPQGGSFYYSLRVRSAGGASDSVPPIGSEVATAVGGGVWCSVPLALYADSIGTLPRGSASTLRPRRPEGWFPTGNDRATRLADVMLFWNVAQHFYPYFDVVDTDWPAQLPIALRRAAADSNGASFEITVRRLVAQLHDGHGSVNSPYGDPRPLPLAWGFVEGKLVVLRPDSAYADRLHSGDEVTTIQGRPVAEWVKEAEPTKCAATPQWLRLRVAEALQVMTRADTVALEVRSLAGGSRRVMLPRQAGPLRRPARPDSISEIAHGVMYLDLDRITDEDFNRALPDLLKAKGVIFDLRGYPNRVSIAPLTHLTDSTLTSARWNVPLVTRPDHRDMKFEFSNWPVQPQAPRIRARTAFLIDGSAISYAETYLGIVEHYHLAELVGEPTAGTNGNINTVDLPGGYAVTFTGMKVLKHDGSRHHGVGILPTVPVSPTIAGIAAGRDEQLEKAIAVVAGTRH